MKEALVVVVGILAILFGLPLLIVAVGKWVTFLLDWMLDL